MKIRTRFAPSPTGYQHIGGLRTALYNYLYAKKHGGKFILRIEDTDQSRYDPKSEIAIYESLEWLGLNWDEIPGKKPDTLKKSYVQSKRKSLYREIAQQLVNSGNAYFNWTYYLSIN